MAMWPLHKKPEQQDLVVPAPLHLDPVREQNRQLKQLIAEAEAASSRYGLSPMSIGGGAGVASAMQATQGDTAKPIEPTFNGISGINLICARLRMNAGELRRRGLDIAAIRDTKDHTVVFGTANDAPIMLTDEKNLFPSDTLITKIQALLK